MNESLIRTRYARALVRYVLECGRGEQVCAQAETLAGIMASVPELKRMIASRDIVSSREKIALLHKAFPEGMENALDRFLRLLADHDRIDMLEVILRNFTDQYRRAIGLRNAHLHIAVQPDEALLERLRELVRKQTGDDAHIAVEVDPDLIGGFIFDIDDHIIDTSVSSSLERIRAQFNQINRRIV